MTLGNILRPESILESLEARDAAEIVQALAKALPVPESCREEIARSALAPKSGVYKRTDHGSALLCGSADGISGPALAIARLAPPNNAAGREKKTTGFAFLLAVSRENISGHLYPLSALSQISGRKGLLRALSEARTREDLHGLLAGVPL
ncbi:MAG TPA: hypothetical protein VNH15_00495 [Elusimicrobiota bacterium]|nr:hypothetical protein [Elusimicrobiota bacterium]